MRYTQQLHKQIHKSHPKRGYRRIQQDVVSKSESAVFLILVIIHTVRTSRPN